MMLIGKLEARQMLTAVRSSAAIVQSGRAASAPSPSREPACPSRRRRRASPRSAPSPSRSACPSATSCRHAGPPPLELHAAPRKAAPGGRGRVPARRRDRDSAARWWRKPLPVQVGDPATARRYRPPRLAHLHHGLVVAAGRLLLLVEEEGWHHADQRGERGDAEAVVEGPHARSEER